MDYNLTEAQKAILRWMVEANQQGELDEEFTIAWTMGGYMIINRSRASQPENPPEMTPGILDALEEDGLIRCDVSTETKTRRSGGTKSRPQYKELQHERSRRCSITPKAFEAVESDFVAPEPPPASATFHFHGDVNQSIIGTQNRAELANNFDFGNIRERIEREGGEDKEELCLALEQVERLLEEGERLDRGSLSRFSEAMQRHSWFTGAVMALLLGFATQVVS